MTALGGPSLKNEEEENEDLFQDATDTLHEENKLIENNKFDYFEENYGGNGSGGWSEKSSSFCFDEEEPLEIFKGNVGNNSIKNKNNSFIKLNESSSSSKVENNLNQNLDLSKCKIILTEQQNLNNYKENTQPIIYSNLPISKRRSKIPPKPESHGLNLWSIMKNCIGKELTRIPIPVNFNEPLSMLQRITEDLEYSYLLDRASEKSDISERLAYTAAFAISCYSATAKRTTKPFNPLLGETFEFDRRADLGWRSLTEQVSHHPPAAAMFTESVNWELSQEFMVASRFRGKYMSVIPTGYTQIKFKDGKANFIFQKVTTTVHNIIVGKLWIDNHGTMNIVNHISGERATIKFHSYSYFSSDRPRKVEGIILDKKGNARFYIFGYWDNYLNIASINSQKNQQGKVLFETGEPKRIWTVNEPLGDSSMFNFTKLAIEMNEPDNSVAPTDSRFRPDQRLMENGDWDGANDRKNELENKQRKARREAEAETERAINNNQQPKEYEACWFQKVQDTNTGSVIHTIRGNEYWECKDKKDWSKCPNIY
uniref:Oxysterol-binding protein n=1 Tax=Meloidogyne hapla TaxID=6305 RepID=A0A1I8BK17_MELHA